MKILQEPAALLFLLTLSSSSEGNASPYIFRSNIPVFPDLSGNEILSAPRTKVSGFGKISGPSSLQTRISSSEENSHLWRFSDVGSKSSRVKLSSDFIIKLSTPFYGQKGSRLKRSYAKVYRPIKIHLRNIFPKVSIDDGINLNSIIPLRNFKHEEGSRFKKSSSVPDVRTYHEKNPCSPILVPGNDFDAGMNPCSVVLPPKISEKFKAFGSKKSSYFLDVPIDEGMNPHSITPLGLSEKLKSFRSNMGPFSLLPLRHADGGLKSSQTKNRPSRPFMFSHADGGLKSSQTKNRPSRPFMLSHADGGLKSSQTKNRPSRPFMFSHADGGLKSSLTKNRPSLPFMLSHASGGLKSSRQKRMISLSPEEGNDCNEVKNYTIITSQENWFGALTSCISRGEQLATIRSAEEQEKVENVLKEEGKWVSSRSFWVNGHGFNDEGKFVWETNPYGEMEYSHWASGQPALQFPLKKCLLLGKNHEWNVELCFKKFGYVCQKISSDCPPAVSLY